MMFGRDHDDVANAEDDVPEGDGVSSADEVGQWATQQGSKKSTYGKETDDETGSYVAEVVGSVIASQSKALKEVRHS
jgi:hypothetical protein